MRPVDRVAGISPEPLTRAEHLFGELDGCEIHSAAGQWVAAVLGIHVDRNEAWIQLSLDGDPPCSLVVHLLPAATGRQTIGAISLWLDRAPLDRPAILEVM
jgi:hypothetical protein